MAPIHLHTRDAWFIGLVAATLLAIAGFLTGSLGTAEAPAGGWRRIDLERLEQRLDAGELMRHEAEWYAPVRK